MSVHNRSFLLSAILLVGFLLSAAPSMSQELFIDSTKIQAHPRLLLLKGEEERIKSEIRNNAMWKNVHDAILKECDTILKKHPVERTMIGRRLLQVSREGLRRIFFLGYAWRTTGKKKIFLALRRRNAGCLPIQ